MSRLIKAASTGNLKVLRNELESGVDPDSRDAQGNTTLMLATYYGHPTCVQALIDAGCDDISVGIGDGGRAGCSCNSSMNAKAHAPVVVCASFNFLIKVTS